MRRVLFTLFLFMLVCVVFIYVGMWLRKGTYYYRRGW